MNNPLSVAAVALVCLTTLIVGVGLVLLRVLLHEERQGRAATPPQV